MTCYLTIGCPFTDQCDTCAFCIAELCREAIEHNRQEALDRQDVETVDEQPKWTHGTLPTRALEGILADVLMDLWHDCYRRDAEMGVRYRMFCEKVVSGLYAATGTKFRVE